MLAHAPTCPPATHARKHTHTHTQTHAHNHTHTHTYTRTQKKTRRHTTTVDNNVHAHTEGRSHPHVCGSERGKSAPVLSVTRPRSPSSRRLRAVSASLTCCALSWASTSGIPRVAIRGRRVSARDGAADAAPAPAPTRMTTPPTTLVVAPPPPPTDVAEVAQGVLAPTAPSAAAATPPLSSPPWASIPGGTGPP